jgi:hypothetical protein
MEREKVRRMVTVMAMWMPIKNPIMIPLPIKDLECPEDGIKKREITI